MKSEILLSKERELFAKWGEMQITHDGIVDKEEWSKANVKVLYILKESNDFPSGSNYTLTDFIKEGARSQTWNNITRWQYGIQSLYTSGTAEFKDFVSNNDRIKILNEIAVMNLKKETGGARSNWKEILKHAQKDLPLLKEQLDLYKPDIIICCGTGDIVVELGLLNNIHKSVVSSNGIRYIIDSGKLLIKYFHPQAYKGKEYLFNNLMSILKEVKPHL